MTTDESTRAAIIAAAVARDSTDPRYQAGLRMRHRKPVTYGYFRAKPIRSADPDRDEARAVAREQKERG
jgi:hypothetical protein